MSMCVCLVFKCCLSISPGISIQGSKKVIIIIMNIKPVVNIAQRNRTYLIKVVTKSLQKHPRERREKEKPLVNNLNKNTIGL